MIEDKRQIDGIVLVIIVYLYVCVCVEKWEPFT